MCFVLFLLKKRAAFQWKDAILGFRVSPGSAEAQVRWGWKLKHILIAYFLGSICSKNYRNRAVYVKIIASQRWDVFLDTMYCTSFYGSVLSDLGHPAISAFCAACRKSLRRVWGVPYWTHSSLLRIMSSCLPLLDELCCRTALFIKSCLESDSPIVSTVTRYYCLKTSQFKTVCKDDSGYITTKTAKSKRWYYLSAHRHIVSVLTSNITFLIFAVLVMWCSHCRPYKPF